MFAKTQKEKSKIVLNNASFVVVAKPLMNTALLRDFQFDVLGLWFPFSTVLNTSKGVGLQRNPADMGKLLRVSEMLKYCIKARPNTGIGVMDDNTPAHASNMVQDCLLEGNREALRHPPLTRMTLLLVTFLLFPHPTSPVLHQFCQSLTIYNKTQK